MKQFSNTSPECSYFSAWMCDGEAWWAAVYGVAQSRTWLKRLSSSSSRPLSAGLAGATGRVSARSYFYCICWDQWQWLCFSSITWIKLVFLRSCRLKRIGSDFPFILFFVLWNLPEILNIYNILCIEIVSLSLDVFILLAYSFILGMFYTLNHEIILVL